MIRDHEPIAIRAFRGTFNRGEDEVVPRGFFRDSLNVRFSEGGVETRFGTTQSVTFAGMNQTGIKRAAAYKRVGEADRLLLLDGAGNIYDSTDLVTPILSVAAMSDFSMVSMFNRAYISPHNGVIGLPGEKVYVYEGAGLARQAAGTPPSTGAGGNQLILADSLQSGKIEEGIHLVGVCFETSSGYVTAPGGYAMITAGGNKKLDVSNIPIGPAGTVARVLVVTKVLTTFNGDFTNQVYYFAPDGRVPDNATTTATLDFYDADLASSADYLMDQLASIPAGVGLCVYRGRLIVWGSNENRDYAYVSKSGEPESVDGVEGFFAANPGDSGGGIKNCWEYRGQLIAQKSQRSYLTQDNGSNAAFWEVTGLDPSIGAECHSVGKIMDFGNATEDRVIVADRAGLRVFTGTFSENVLSYVIDDLWDSINKLYFHTVETAVDPLNAMIYCAVPLGAATAPSHVLVADYSEGLDAKNIRWTVWSFPRAPQTVLVDVDSATKRSVFKFGAANGNVYAYDTASRQDFGNAIESYVQFPLLPDDDDDDAINHFTGIKVRIKGSGVLQISMEDLDATTTLTAQSLGLTAQPGRSLFKGFSFKSERCSVKLRMNLANEYFILTKFSLFIRPLWASRPA